MSEAFQEDRPGPDTAFLVYTHKATPEVMAKIAAARADLAGRCDVHVIGYFPDAASVPAALRDTPGVHAYGPDDMAALGYPSKGAAPFRITPGHGDMLFIRFSQAHPRYRTIWIMEWDVAFTGHLGTLVSAFEGSPAAVICTNILPVSPHWRHLPMTLIPANWPARPFLRGFLPVARFSRDLVEAVDRFYRDGGAGHYELTWLYVAEASGLEIEDFGGDGAHVRPGNRNRFYTSTARVRDLYPGTFRYRPPMRRPGRRPDTLWHPVKDDPVSLPRYIADRARILIRRLLLPREKQ